MKPLAGQDASNSTLLVRRVSPDALDPVHMLLARPDRPHPVSPDELVLRAGGGGVFELGDVTIGRGGAPVAAAVFEPDRSRGTARLECVVVRPSSRGAGLARRLVEEASVLLRADGLDLIEARLEPWSEQGRFLQAVGFLPVDGSLMVLRG